MSTIASTVDNLIRTTSDVTYIGYFILQEIPLNNCLGNIYIVRL